MGDRDVALAPAFSQHDGLDGTRERDVLWPLIHQRESQRERGWGLRPLFFHRTSKDGYRSETTFVWPLGRYSTRPGQVELRLTPLFGYTARYNEAGTVDRDWIVFPLTMFGSDAKEGDYFSLFPFFGSTRSKLAREKMSYVLFPLYIKTYDYGYEGTNILFPFYAHGSGRGRSVFTLFPFYMRQAKEGRYDRRSYLWPFVHVQENNLQSDDPIDTWMLWPLYGQDVSRSGDKVGRTVLWPFFSWRVHADGDYTEYNLPWPFWRYLRSTRVDHDRFWPLYSRHEDRSKRLLTYQILWPIGWWQSFEERTYTKRSLWIIPLFWDHQKTWTDDRGGTDRYTKLWPLFHRHRARDGAVEHAALSLWWFRDQEPYGFRDNYDPLFTLYYLRDDPAAQESLVSVLGPIFRYHTTPARTDLRALVFRWKRQGEGPAARKEWSLLEGLVGYADDAGRKTLRLLYLPIRWGASNLPGGSR